MANSGGGGEFKSDIRKQEKMKFVSVGHHHAAGLEYASTSAYKVSINFAY